MSLGEQDSTCRASSLQSDRPAGRACRSLKAGYGAFAGDGGLSAGIVCCLVAGYVVFTVGAISAAGMLAVWLHRRLAERRARGGRRW